jgi:hypothetical protein
MGGVAMTRATNDLLGRCARPRRVRSRTDLRTGSIPDVQLIGGAGPWEVDLLIRVLPTGRLEIVGQVTSADRVYEPVWGLQLSLCDADSLEVVGRTRTDAMGEFDLRGLRAARYALVFGNDSEAPCLLVWEGESRVASCETPV